MMDWTDRHCRYFLRGFSPRLLLYTEMITAAAILRGDRERLLRFHPDEHPLALQLGGSEPGDLARAAAAGEAAGYDEINLNCGCPSDRVRRGTFGACLMSEPLRVADCVAAMRAATRLPVTVKMRIGTVDATGGALRERVAAFSPEDRQALERFVGAIRDAGAAAAIVHARKAVLGAWSPKDNREIPPLRYDVVQELRAAFPSLMLVVNGGLRDVDGVRAVLRWCDGAMLGREAYHRPMVLAELDAAVLRSAESGPATRDASAAPLAASARGPALPSVPLLLERMARYAEAEMSRGERLGAITRHMLGLLSHSQGAREFRRMLSEGARAPGAGPELIRRAAALAA
jgi:tRNA-dihydrouridine synthase A